MNDHAHDHDGPHHHHRDHADEPELDFASAVLEGRAAKDRFFATNPNSPILRLRAMGHGHDHEASHQHDHDHVHDHDGPASSHASADPAEPPFEGLTYFPPDERYQFHVSGVRPYEGDQPVEFEMTTSDGRVRTAYRVATLPFELNGDALRLHAYRFAGSDQRSLFVPFQDATSGIETYGAARYLDLELEDDGSVILDFNMAYHPYCAYNEAYSCPLPPAENRLPVRIEAGERLPS